ncbi:hypothetical protein VTK56DRAFT_144 [Thermocarpiscus australiensis]
MSPKKAKQKKVGDATHGPREERQHNPNHRQCQVSREGRGDEKKRMTTRYPQRREKAMRHSSGTGKS